MNAQKKLRQASDSDECSYSESEGPCEGASARASTHVPKKHQSVEDSDSVWKKIVGNG